MDKSLSSTQICYNIARNRKLGRIANFMKALSVYNQRQSLLKMTESELRDIGITADDARAEARRGFWDIDDAGA